MDTLTPTPWSERFSLGRDGVFYKTVQLAAGGLVKLVFNVEKLLNRKEDGGKQKERPQPSELMARNGFNCQIHEVTTEDGYVLTLHRIVPKDGNPQNEPKEVVFLQHGLVDSSSTWIMNSRKDSLGYMLADAGYDVWLGNVRGNVYSTRHRVYPENDDRYWDFTWDDMAKKDLPAMINYVLAETTQKDLYYFGHSQGGLIGFTEFSRNTLLASKIKHFFALAPAVYLGDMSTDLRILIDIRFYIKKLFTIFFSVFWLLSTLPIRPFLNFFSSKDGRRPAANEQQTQLKPFNPVSFDQVMLQIMPIVSYLKQFKLFNELSITFGSIFFQFYSVFKSTYERFVINIMMIFWTAILGLKGVNGRIPHIISLLPEFKYPSVGLVFSCGKSSNISDEDLKEYMLSYPSDSSIKNLMHFIQLTRNGRPEGFNYGLSIQNYKVYQQIEPPVYNIQDINRRVGYTIYYGENDALVPASGIEKHFPIEKCNRIKGFNHVDFVWSPNAAALVYKPIMNKLIELRRH